MKQLLIAGALVCAFAGSAAAQDHAAPPPSSSGVTDYTFRDGDRIEGSAPEASGILAIVRTLNDRRSLIRTRAGFVNEMLKSVENL